MKRQTGSVSIDARDEVEQNKCNENKRLKLLHNELDGEAKLILIEAGTSSCDHPVSVNDQSHEGTLSWSSDVMQDSKPNGSSSNCINSMPSTSLKMDSFENDITPHANGDQRSLESYVTEPYNISSIVQNSPHVSLRQISADVILNGSTIVNDSLFQPTVPENILEDSFEGSSQSDTDIENSPSYNDPAETKINKNCFDEPSHQESMTSSDQRETESEPIVSKLQTGSWNFDIENITTSSLQVTDLEGHADFIFSVAADKNIILSSSGDTTIKVWNTVENGEICSFRGHSDAVTSVILLSKEQTKELSSIHSGLDVDRIVMSASLDCSIRLWSVLNGEELLSLYTFNGITSMSYLDNQLYAIIGTDGGKIELWDIRAAKVVHSVLAHEDSISDIQVSDSYVYSASVDGSVKVWLVDDNELQPLYTRRRKEMSPDKTGFNPTQWKALATHDDILYLGDNTSNLKVLDWRAGRMKLIKNQIEEPGVTDAMLIKNNILLSAFYETSSDTGGINVWQLPAMTYVCTISGDVQEICSLAITETDDGKLRIVSGGHKLLVWDFDSSIPPTKSPMPFFTYCAFEELGLEVERDTLSAHTPEVSSKIPSGSDTGYASDKASSWCNLM